MPARFSRPFTHSLRATPFATLRTPCLSLLSMARTHLPPPRLPAAALAIALALLPAAPALAQTAAPRAGQNVTLDFDNADIDAVARTMAVLTGRNVVVDPRVKGAITLTSTAPVSPAQAMRLFATQLRTQGFALVERDGMSLVVPEAEAKLQSGSVQANRAPASGGQVLTQIFRLTHENANDLVPILRPLMSPNNTINVNPGANALVITDYGDNLQRLGRIIAALDVANATDMEIVRLQHAVASDLAPLVAQLLDSGSSGPGAQRPAGGAAAGAPAQAQAQTVAGGGGYRTTLIPEPRSNAIIVRAANAARLALAKKLIHQLDQPPHTRADGGSGNIHVVYLKNADATKLATTLRAALAALPGQNASGGTAPASSGGSSGGASSSANANNNSGGASSSLSAGPSLNPAADNQPSTGGQIQADPATNSLIISAPEPVYRELRAVINQLDQRRAQVYIESLIAEVDMQRSADFGVQWQGILGNQGDRNIGYLGTNFGALNNGNIFGLGNAINNIIDGGNRAVTNLPRTGMNLALAHDFGAGYLLSALANFIQSTRSGNVLSTPTLLTLDNEEAKIIVGENRPFITGSYTNAGSGSTLNPFQTYERQDVGLTLRVRPQISENGTIKLVIYQESSSVQGDSDAGPITRKRAIESSVLVEDGAVIALGGLLEDQYRDSVNKVPGLGDVPVLGNLFKSQNRTQHKTNLMVFLRPVIVRDAAATESYSLNRYDLIRASQQAQQPEHSSVLQINNSTVLPPVQPVTPTGWSRPAPPDPLVPATPRRQSRTRTDTEMPASGEQNYIGGAIITPDTNHLMSMPTSGN